MGSRASASGSSDCAIENRIAEREQNRVHQLVDGHERRRLDVRRRPFDEVSADSPFGDCTHPLANATTKKTASVGHRLWCSHTFSLSAALARSYAASRGELCFRHEPHYRFAPRHAGRFARRVRARDRRRARSHGAAKSSVDARYGRVLARPATVSLAPSRARGGVVGRGGSVRRIVARPCALGGTRAVCSSSPSSSCGPAHSPAASGRA